MEVDLVEMDYSVPVSSDVTARTEEEVEAHCLKEKQCEEKDSSSKVSESGVSSGVKKGNINVTANIRQEFCRERDAKDISSTLKESLADYCVRVVRCCPDLCAVLTTVNECHVHEVELFFQAVRLQEPALVGQLQEQLLDSGSHNRLVTILSDMYA